MFQLSPFPLKPSQRWLLSLLLALVYYGVAALSRLVATTPDSVTPVWPPDGIALGMVLIYGYQILPGVFVGSFLANIWAFLAMGTTYQTLVSVLQVVAIALGTTAGMALGKYIFDHTIHRKNPLKQLDDLCKFLLLIGLGTPAVNATTGVLALVIGPDVNWSTFHSNWLTWWISNVSGIYIFTPAFISWYELFRQKAIASSRQKSLRQALYHSNLFGNYPPRQLSSPKTLEFIILFIIIFLISAISFYQDLHFEYMLIPCLIWAVIRFGQFEVTNAILIILTLAVLGTVRGLGVFASEDTNQSLLRLQLFTVVVVVTNLSLLASLAEKKNAFENVRQSKLHLQEKSAQLEQSQQNLKNTALLLEQQNLALLEAKKAADHANLTKTRFLSSMSHELRTPLNAVIGLVELLKDSEHLDEDEKEDLQTISDSGLHLLNLIEDILDIARIEAGKIELYAQEVQFRKFLQGIRSIIQTQIGNKKVELICDYADPLPPVVYVDEKRLRQVLLNLLHNAVKFTEIGQICFQVRSYPTPEQEENQYLLEFIIEDSGIGIEADKINLIFLPFEQTGKTKLKAQGTGLGLAISQEIVRLMGGKISVVSQPGVGSKFWFRICATGSAEPHSMPSKQLNSLLTLDKNLARRLPLRILLAEDNLTNQKVVLKILDNLGYQADVVVNGLAALEAVRLKTYDVILMDIQMPEMDGLTATQHLLRLNLQPRPYVIAVTANAMQHDRLACLEVGMDDYVTKPINLELLVQALWRSRCCRIG
ncbi:response regulator [Synechococcus moorigangaii CMS01]|nr:response regulator [Synechococcus moorigangaii CMS01]